MRKLNLNNDIYKEIAVYEVIGPETNLLRAIASLSAESTGNTIRDK